MDVIVEIASGQSSDRSIVTREGKNLSFREQSAYVFLPGEKYPRPFLISLGNRPPFVPGRYSLLPSSFSVGRFGELALSRQLDLSPLSASSVAPVGVPAPAASGTK